MDNLWKVGTRQILRPAMSLLPPSDYKSVAMGILALPSALQIDIFAKWIHLKDIAHLDSALCSITLRKAYLESWKEKHCIFDTHHEESIRLEPPVASWIAKRSIKIACQIHFSDEMVMYSELDDFFMSTGQTILNLVYTELFASVMRPNKPPGTVQSFFRKALLCPNLHTLETHEVPWKRGGLREMLTKCNKIKRLVLNFAKNVDLLAFNECGQNVETLEMYYYGTSMESRARRLEGEEEEHVPIQYTESHSLRKFVFLSAAVSASAAFLPGFLCCNKGLRELYVDRIGYYDMTYIAFCCPELTILRVDMHLEELDEPLDDEEDLPNIIDNTKNVRYLQLTTEQAEMDLFTEEQILLLLRACPQYVVLVLFDMRVDMWLNDKFPLPALTRTLSPSTSCLQVLHVRTLSLPALRQVFALCPHLVELGVTDPDDLPGLVALVVEKKIRRLHLQLPMAHSCEALRDLRGLEFLHLFNCTDLASQDLLAIASNNPELNYIRVYDCETFEGAGLEEVVRLCPLLRCLHVDDGSENREDECAYLKCIHPVLETVYIAYEGSGDDEYDLYGEEYDEEDQEFDVED